LYARDPSVAPDDWHRASSLAAQSVICEMTCARSCGLICQAHELSITLNRATLTQSGVARIVTSSAHFKDAGDLKIHSLARHEHDGRQRFLRAWLMSLAASPSGFAAGPRNIVDEQEDQNQEHQSALGLRNSSGTSPRSRRSTITNCNSAEERTIATRHSSEMSISASGGCDHTNDV
jgi:hypothetical protein